MTLPLFDEQPSRLWLSACGGWIYNVWRAVQMLYWLQRDEQAINAPRDPDSTWPFNGLDGTGRYSLADKMCGLDLGPISLDELDEAWAQRECDCPVLGSCDECGALELEVYRRVEDIRSPLFCSEAA